MFTSPQVSAVLSVAVSDGQHPIGSSLLLCGWASVGEPQVGGKKLSVSLITERTFAVGKAPIQGIVKSPPEDLAPLFVKRGSACV